MLTAPTFVYTDAEFIPHNPTRSGLISIALHSKESSLYLINGNVDPSEIRDASDAGSAWRREHVWSKLPVTINGGLDWKDPDVRTYSDIRLMVDQYFHALTDGQNARRRIGLIADHGTQDVQRLHNLWDNDWSKMPVSVPRHLFQDLATLEDLAGADGGFMPDGEMLPVMFPVHEHHALRDAEYDRELHEFLLKRSRAVRIACGVEQPTI